VSGSHPPMRAPRVSRLLCCEDTLMPVAQLLGNAGEGQLLVFFCPGCKYDHGVTVALPPGVSHDEKHPLWTWNGNLEKPTAQPSLLVNQHQPSARCHLFIREGQLQFLPDCYHQLAGQTVDMVSYPEGGAA
jgi:hypothetical protein